MYCVNSVLHLQHKKVSTWFANARRRLKKENKMQWSPRNRTGEDDDEDDDDDDGAERKCESADGFDACKMDEKDENEDEENIVVDAGKSICMKLHELKYFFTLFSSKNFIVFKNDTNSVNNTSNVVSFKEQASLVFSTAS